jgi:hypothetical protein
MFDFAHFSYYTYCTLDLRDSHHHELGYLYLRTVFSLFSVLLRADLLSQLVKQTAIPLTQNPGSEQPQRVTLNTGSGDDLEAR